MGHTLLKWLFSRKQTYIEMMVQEQNDPSRFLLVTARRVMPEYGDSFDVWTVWLFDIKTLRFTKGISQAGENFKMKSPFAHRALDDLRRKSKHPPQKIAPYEKLDSEKEEDEDNAFAFADGRKQNVKIVDILEMASDTEELPDLPNDGLVFKHRTKYNRDFFALKLLRKGKAIAEHQFVGDGSYARFCFRVNHPDRIVFTYRKLMLGEFINGMAVCVLDATTGQVLYDDFIL